MQIPRGQMQFGDVVNVRMCLAVSTWQWECSKPWVAVLDALLPLPATFLSCTAEPLLELALLLQREGWI